jgi:uncharacterized RDD family membrane protein YckC
MIRHGTNYVCAGCKPRFLQKLAEGVRLPGQLHYAGFWRRFAAVFIDGLLLGVLYIGFLILFPLIINSEDSGQVILYVLLLYVVLFGSGLAYETVLIKKYGATLGKMVCHLEVIPPEGKSMTYSLALVRHLAKLLSYITFYIGFIIAAFDSQKRALHDHICNTRVVVK